MNNKKILLLIGYLIISCNLVSCKNKEPTEIVKINMNNATTVEETTFFISKEINSDIIMNEIIENSENQDNISSTNETVEDTSESSTDTVEILNFTEPEIGEEIVVINVKDYGTIKIKLFSDECPKGVENFKRLISEKNYYDNVIFHRVIKDFVIQGGDPNGNGTGGESIWGDGFERELHDGLRHFAGAVAYATNSIDHLNKSQFYIVSQNNGYDFNESYFNMIESSYDISFPNNVREKYHEVGGTPFLDNNYEVFGQVFEGLDVVKAIAENETDNNDKPLEDVVIESATIKVYKG